MVDESYIRQDYRINWIYKKKGWPDEDHPRNFDLQIAF